MDRFELPSACVIQLKLELAWTLAKLELNLYIFGQR
jgi:hypothetical protein